MKRNYLFLLNILVLLSTATALLFLPTGAYAALLISGVTPSTISNNHSNTITVSGNDFVMGTQVSLDGYDKLNTSYYSNTTLMAEVPAGIPTGVYTVTVTNPDSSSASLPNCLTVITGVSTITPTGIPYPPPPTIITPAFPTITRTPTNEPPVGYERPVIVVNSYNMSQERISPGDYFILYLTLYNAGQQYATNVVANFTPGDLIPRETGGVVAVGEIAPSNRLDFAQPFILSSEAWGSVASINMLVTYTDQNGVLYSETFVISLPVYHAYSAASTSTPTPTTTPSPTPSIKPQLVITGYTTDVNPLQPGAQFNLAITIQNKGTSTAKRVTMIVGGGSSLSVMEAHNNLVEYQELAENSQTLPHLEFLMFNHWAILAQAPAILHTNPSLLMSILVLVLTR
jgi:hypothetical protein